MHLDLQNLTLLQELLWLLDNLARSVSLFFYVEYLLSGPV
jgi:hypothetical protein